MTQPEFLHAVKEDSAKKAGDYQERSRENEISDSLCGQKTLKNIKKKKESRVFVSGLIPLKV